MRTEHPCVGGNAEITFRRDGQVIQRWIRLCGDSGNYWGGWTAATEHHGFAHQLVTEYWMFRQIAQFAHDTQPGTFYALCGHGWTSTISTRMEADQIAGPLACDPARVRHYFALSVEVPEPDEMAEGEMWHG